MLRERPGNGWFYRNPFDPYHQINLEEIASPAYVVCPTCQKRAEFWVRPVRVSLECEEEAAPEDLKSVFWCASCLKKNFDVSWLRASPAGVASICGYKIWAQTRVGSNVLWAYNAEHLLGIEGAILGKSIAKAPKCAMPRFDWRSRIPAWIKLKKSRSQNLWGVERLRKLLPPVE